MKDEKFCLKLSKEIFRKIRTVSYFNSHLYASDF
jgi:hypothetical protein